MTTLSTRHAENSFFNTGLLLEEKQHPHTLIINLVYVIKFSLYIFFKSGLLQALNYECLKEYYSCLSGSTTVLFLVIMEHIS